MNKSHNNQRGAVLVEFVIVFPLLLLITFGIIFIGLNISQRELYQASLLRFGRVLGTGHSEILPEFVCQPSYLTQLLITGKSAAPDSSASDLASSPTLFPSLDQAGFKADAVTASKYSIKQLIPNTGSSTPRWYYLTIELSANLNYAICMPGIGCLNNGKIEEKNFFILEANSPLLGCLPNNSTTYWELK